MDKKSFKTLLTDLYNIYNPKKIGEADHLSEKYNGQEFDAIKTFYFKYNFRANAKYDPKAGTDKHVKYLIDKYSTGERVLLKDGAATEINVENITFDKKVEEANIQLQDITDKNKESIDNYLNEKSKELDKYFIEKNEEIKKQNKEIENLVSENFKIINEKLKELNIPLSERELKIKEQNDMEERVELKMNLDFDSSDVELPKELNTMPSGSRFLILDSNQKMCALEIKDIFYDYVSFPGKCIKEITIEKA